MKKLLPIFLLISFTPAAWGQNTIGIPQVINFSNNVFKGGLQTWDIRQDGAGRMYFANNEGLVVYDGTYWKTYPQPNRTILRSIALDGNRIYAGGQDEIGYYTPNANGILQYTSLKPLIPKQYSNFVDVWDIEIFKGAVFFRTWDRIYTYKDGVVLVYPAQSGWEFLKKTTNKLIAQDKKRGLFQFINEEWRPLGPVSSAPGFELTGIVELENDTLLLASLQNGLYTFHQGNLAKKRTEADEWLIKNHIYCFERINSSEFVAGSTSQGCLMINAAGTIVQQVARPEGLQNNNVLSVFLDKDQNLWAGLDNGISFIAYNSAIKYIKPGKPDEVSGYSARIYNNGLYIATSDGAFYAPLSPNAGTDLSFAKSSFSQLENSGGQVWRFDEVNNQLLMGHHRGSFLIRKNQVVPLQGGSGAWLFLPTSSVYPAQNILVGTYVGLYMLGYHDDRLVNEGILSGGMNESVRFMAIDNENTVWASHPYRGVYRMKLAPDGHSFTYNLYTQDNGLPSTMRVNVFRVKNRVVFATEQGIYEFDKAQNKFIPSPFLYHIFGNRVIQYLKEDTDGNIWFCGDKKIGIVDFSGTEPALTFFPELTGKVLAGFENIYPYNQENIFIASDAGIIHLNYKKYIIGNKKPHILLTQVRLSGKSDSLIFGGYFLQGKDSSHKTIPNTAIHFQNNNNSFHFEFSSPSFGLQSNIEYRYQLRGYDREWSASTSKTEKEYTNLPEGYYTFIVKARDNLGNESETVNYSFVIKPAWYKNGWAYLFYIVLLGVLIYFLYRLQQKKFRLQQLKFEEEQARLKYIHQLEVEKNEKEIIQLQHEKLINEMIYKKKELADVSMHLVERSDALTKVKDELQRLQKKTGGDHDVQRALQLVNEIEKNNSNWEQFAAHFDEINNDFIKNLKSKFPSLTSTDLKVCTYLQMKLASKEIAQLMNISLRGVEISRYRLRKKLQLPTGKTLNDFLNEIHPGKGSE